MGLDLSLSSANVTFLFGICPIPDHVSLALFLLRAFSFPFLGSASRPKAVGITHGPGMEFWSGITHWVDGSETPITGRNWGLDSLWHAVAVLC